MQPQFETRLATTPDEIALAQRLRYQVFVEELGGDGPLVDHEQHLEKDHFDPYFDHLLLYDHNRPSELSVVGVYRIMREVGAKQAGGWYSANEYDLSVLETSGRRLMELGRSCLHADYRGGVGLMHMWQALSEYVQTHEIEILFGVASFHGTNTEEFAAALSLLHHRYLAAPNHRVHAIGPTAISMGMMPLEAIDRPAAMRAIPPLIKGYLRMGGKVGQGAWVDHTFQTTDICLILDVADVDRHKTAHITSSWADP